MADWDYRPEEEQEKGKKERGGVTRKEFYLCFAILLAVLFWRTGSLAESMQRQENNAEYILQRIEDVSAQMYQISDEVAQGVEEANAPLRECIFEIADVDLRKKTATLRLTAKPKEYRAGATALRFILTCDEDEPIVIEATVGENRIFMAEKEIPFCDTVSATAVLTIGDAEYIAQMGTQDVASSVYPDFQGFFGGSYQWTGDGTAANVSGMIQVDVTPSEWEQMLALEDAKAEIYLDGKRIQTIPMEVVEMQEDWAQYFCDTEKDFRMREGEILEVYFKAEDADGLKYTYLIERSEILQGDILTADIPQSDRLTVE